MSKRKNGKIFVEEIEKIRVIAQVDKKASNHTFIIETVAFKKVPPNCKITSPL